VEWKGCDPARPGRQLGLEGGHRLIGEGDGSASPVLDDGRHRIGRPRTGTGRVAPDLIALIHQEAIVVQMVHHPSVVRQPFQQVAKAERTWSGSPTTHLSNPAGG
jgi:hypothetical protein